jgi:hypothetical protein
LINQHLKRNQYHQQLKNYNLTSSVMGRKRKTKTNSPYPKTKTQITTSQQLFVFFNLHDSRKTRNHRHHCKRVEDNRRKLRKSYTNHIIQISKLILLNVKAASARIKSGTKSIFIQFPTPTLCY